MNIFSQFKHDLLEILRTMCKDAELAFDDNLQDKITSEPPRTPEHGDISSNAAMVLKKLNPELKPQEIADKIITHLNNHPTIESASCEANFINIRLKAHIWQQLLDAIIQQEKAFGKNTIGQNTKINVEYVSVNPTGPLHIGHARGAIVGDVLARLLEFSDYNVTSEYYINDGGAQVDWLARSAYWRYCEAAGENTEKTNTENLYPGDYLIPIGKQLYEKYGNQFIGKQEADWLDNFREFSVSAMMEIIKDDLQSLKIHHNVFTSERNIIQDGTADEVVKILTDNNHLYQGTPEAPKGKQDDDYEPRPQLLFRSTTFGDDQDRALKKSDDSWTYFTADAAYHLDKYRRGFQHMINIFGADHAGYVTRMKAAMKALADDADLQILTCQLVRFMDNGEPVKMSKRAGRFVTLQDLVREVGCDAARIYMLTRKADAQLDFDFTKTIEANRDNPVFYIQYAHARSYSVEKMFSEAFEGENWQAGNSNLLTREGEILLLKKLAEWPRQVELATKHLEPHRISFYAYELASLFHSLWGQGNVNNDLRFVIADNLSLTQARIKLIMGMRYVLQAAATIIGFDALEEL